MNLKEKAIEKLTLSPLYTNREKIETAEILNKELTIQLVDLVNYNESKYAVVVFKEMPNRVYNAGTVLTELVIEWLSESSIDEVNAELAENEIVIVLTLKKSSVKNREYVSIEVI
ncbi:MAG: hypothetical protein NC200_02685 [Candidatus Gastranaerophilales bacterium]|nr:hypothetical protein [Candidatus Gastranaerophilales bacterium]